MNLSVMMPLSGYAGEIAGFIAEKIEDIRELLQKSNALSFVAKGTFRQLDEIFSECSLEGWGGDKAKPISGEVLQDARKFLDSFPLGIEAPEVGAEPDGAITLEWYRSPNKVISISINPDGWMYYAALIGTSKRHGADSSLMGISDNLVELILQVTRGG